MIRFQLFKKESGLKSYGFRLLEFNVKLFPFDGEFLASWICSGSRYNNFQNVELLYRIFCFTRLLLVKSWSQSGDVHGHLAVFLYEL